MNDQEVTLSSILYYAHEGNYRHIQTALLDLLKRFGSDSVLLFWKGFGMILEDRLIEGIRELSMLQDRPELLLCVPLALIHAHKKCNTVDREAIQQLEGQIRNSRSSCTDKAFYYGSIVLWLTNRHDKARDYLDKSLKLSPNDKNILSLKGWVDLTCSKDSVSKKSIKYFDDACKVSDTPSLDAILGRVRYYTLRYSYAHSLDIINSALVNIPACLPLYVEKLKVQLALHDWDGAVETAQRCHIIDSYCIQATSVLALEKCVRQGNMDETGHILGDLVEQLDQSEPRSHNLYYTMSRTFSRIAGGHAFILQQTRTLIERAISINSVSSDYVVEQAQQILMAGKIDEALKTFKKAFSIDEGSVSALSGLIHCKLLLHKRKEAEQQLEFLNELQKTVGKSSELYYLNALLSQQKGVESDHVIRLLNTAVKTHFANVKGYPLGLEYFYLINPDFIMRIAQSMMIYAPSEPSLITDSSSNLLHNVSSVLDPLTHAAPGLLYAQLILARIKYLSGDFTTSLSSSQLCIDGDYNVIEALHLQAVIHLQQGNHQMCAQVLETALSRNFEVQQYSLYHLIKGRQQFSNGNLQSALTSLKTALSLKNSSIQGNRILSTPSLSDWVSCYLNIGQIHIQLGQHHEATKIMQDTINEFIGTPEEARVTTANAELLISRGNIKEALGILQKVTEDKPYYIQAKERMANVYLRFEKNKEQYIQCYQELAEKLPGPPTAQLLGDALMNVQEPEKALEVYEKALKKSPKDSTLASKVGQTYVRIHHYNKAINYYEASLKSNDLFALRYDLTNLYFKLHQYDKAERTLLTALERDPEEEGESLELLQEEVQYCLLLAKVYHKTGRPDESLDILGRAHSVQKQVVKRASVDVPDIVNKERELLINILCELAKEVEGISLNSPQTEEYYKQAVEINENHTKARVLLAEWYLSAGEMEQCEQQCIALIKKDPSNDSASMLMAEILVMRGNMDGAIRHFEDILIKNPNHYSSLVRLIDLKRRVGQLEKAHPYVTQAESHVAQSVHEPGLNFCKGVYHRYMGEMEEALIYFNHARKDTIWGEKAVFNMIEICLNFDDILGGETLKNSDSESSVEKNDSELMAIKTAEKLLKELQPENPASILKLKVLENFILLATKSRQGAEKVMLKVQDMSTSERESIPVLVLMATAYIILKQVPRARNQLKRLGKTPWVSRYSGELEKGWILLADVYIQSGKYDLAVEQLRKCLQYNKSCSKASEYLGFISEKEQAYQDAATHYENAWRQSFMANPAIGYRLAFNFLKARRYIEAVDVCHEVLDKHPSYPRIKKDILEKARQYIHI